MSLSGKIKGKLRNREQLLESKAPIAGMQSSFLKVKESKKINNIVTILKNYASLDLPTKKFSGIFTAMLQPYNPAPEGAYGVHHGNNFLSTGDQHYIP